MSRIVFVLAITLFARGSGADAQTPTRTPLDVPGFPAATTALLESSDPDYHETLRTLNEAAVRRLLAALQRSRNASGIPVLVWLLANGDSGAYGGNVVYQLSFPEYATRLPFRELADMLSRDEPERRALIAELFANVFAFRRQPMPDADRRRMIAALIDCLDIAHVRLRARAIEALGRARAGAAVRPIVGLLNQPGGDQYQTVSIRALAANISGA